MRALSHTLHDRFPLSALTVALLCLLFAVSGITAHDPWKNIDAINLGIAAGFAGKPLLPFSSWLVPELAGEAMPASPPLYHWLAAGLGNLSELLLGSAYWVGGARLVSSIYLLLGLLGAALAARAFHGKDAGYAAPLFVVGTLGMLLPAHDAQPAIAGLVSVSLTLAGLAWWEIYPRRATLLIASGIAIGFLSDGSLAVLPAVAALVTAAIYPRWRRVAPRAWTTLVLGTVLLVLAWPLALLVYFPAEFSVWINDEWSMLSGALQTDGKRLQLLGWGTWPVLPIAIWSCWLNRHQLGSGRHAVSLSAGLVAVLCLFKSREAVDAVPALTGSLAIIAASGANKFRRGLSNAFEWFSATALSFFMAIIAVAAVAIHTGLPARIAKNFTKPAPGFVAEISPLALLMSVFLIALWLIWLFRAPRSTWRASLRWNVGIVVIWLLTSVLLLPWIDYGKTYRQPVASIKSALDETTPFTGCIERDRLTLAHRASLELFAGIRTVPMDVASACEFRLVLAAPRSNAFLEGWDLVRDVARPGERFERLRLYRRQAP